MKNEKRQLWTWNWMGDGYNSCSAVSRQDAIEQAKKLGASCNLKIDESTLRCVSSEEMHKIDQSWASCFD